MRDPNNVGKTLPWDGCSIGACTPTDFDFVFDLHGIATLIAETKYAGVEIPLGQQKILEREGITHTLAGKFTVVAHLEEPLIGPRTYPNCTVVRYWYLNAWREGKGVKFAALFSWWSEWAQTLSWKLRPKLSYKLLRPDKAAPLSVPEGWPTGMDGADPLSATP